MTRAQIDQIWALQREGRSLRAIATELGVSRPTVTRILKAPPPPLEAAPLPAHMARSMPFPPEAEAPPDDAPAIDQARYLMAEARAAIRLANASGDSQLAQRQTRNAAALMTVLARLERADQESSGGFMTTTDQIVSIRASLRDRMAAICNRPLMCSVCSRALSVSWGTGNAPEAPASR